MTIIITMQEANGLIVDVRVRHKGKIAGKSWCVIDTALSGEKQLEGVIAGLPRMLRSVIKELK